MPHPLAEALVTLLAARRLTLALAETDTGGLIGSALTDVPGSSAVFLGGATPYHNAPKRRLLGVPAEILQRHGAVSEEAVRAMALGARRAFAADIALAESGITGPTGGAPGRPVGTVWIACLGPGDRSVAERHLWSGDREACKRQTLDRALRLLHDAARSAPSSRTIIDTS